MIYINELPPTSPVEGQPPAHWSTCSIVVGGVISGAIVTGAVSRLGYYILFDPKISPWPDLFGIESPKDRTLASLAFGAGMTIVLAVIIKLCFCISNMRHEVDEQRRLLHNADV